MKVIAKEKGFYLAIREKGEVFNYEGEAKPSKKSWFVPYSKKELEALKEQSKESGDSKEPSDSSRINDKEVI